MESKLTNSHWEVVSRGTHLAGVPVENKRCISRAAHTQIPDSYSSLLNVAFSLEPAGQPDPSVCELGGVQGTGGREVNLRGKCASLPGRQVVSGERLTHSHGFAS